MFRITFFYLLAGSTPVFAGTAVESMQVGVLITGFASQTPTTRFASLQAARIAPSRITVFRDGEQIVKEIYY